MEENADAATKNEKPNRNNVSRHKIEALRRAIRDGYPWLLHTNENVFRQTGLSIRENILLSYVTGISAGACVFLAGGDHPSKETVAAVKEELKADIAEAERRRGRVFTGTRHKDGFFRFQNPYSPPRSEY